MKWVGIFGGSFNPPHLGHLLAAVYALKVFELDEVWLMPAYRHRFRKDLAPFKDRVEMCRLLVEGISPKIKVSTFEGDKKSDGKTLNTLRALRKKYPNTYFSLVIGSDLLKETKKWYRFAEIKNRFGVFVVPRGGTKEFGIPDISSSEVRRRLRSQTNLNFVLTSSVAQYVQQHRIFG